ncbi:mediator of RNA polymerase II transcription subunit 27-like [Xenia sp. Carnegie-2017]|uniref:mediator of RNA polymerase II transcription subunit 27-like n=1 Tax=Xenia sp. Carnegie-2017 TaxID=2897299 RepID=UPI001F03A6A4|nr:mediator of RNA polymerase II transcription subunit 27-like [Xenia sp. Carnegie-2017]
MASDSEKEKYKLALVATRDIRNLVNNVFENAIKDFSADKTKLKETLLKLEKKLSDLEKIGVSLKKMDNKPTILGKSGLLWSDPIQDKTPLYDQLMQTYSWTQQLKSQAKTASLCLKRKLSLDVNEIALKKPVKEDVLVSQSTLATFVDQLKKSFPKLTIRWNKIAGVSLLEVCVKPILFAIVILRGCTVDRVTIKGIHETSADKDEFMQCSKYKIFNKMTDIANASSFYYSRHGNTSESLYKLINWLSYYDKLFMVKCRKCKKYLQKEADNILPPCWLDYETFQFYHMQCRPPSS